jgi:hypothetical protein
MSQAAFDSGMVDFVLSAADILAKLVEIRDLLILAFVAPGGLLALNRVRDYLNRIHCAYAATE